MVTSAACRALLTRDGWRTVADVCAALGVTSALERARVTSAMSHDAQRGLADSKVVGWKKNRPVNAYRLRRDALPRSVTCRMAAEARYGGAMRPVLKDMCLSAMQTRPTEEWSTTGIAEAIGKTPNGIRAVLKQLHRDLLVELHEIRHKSYVEARWILTDAGRAYATQGLVTPPPDPEGRVPSRWPGRNHEVLEQAWPHPVQVPEGGEKRVHKMVGGWV